MPNPYVMQANYHPLTCCCARRNFFLNFANAKAAATGFERETRGDLSSLSNSSSLTKRPLPPRPTSVQILRCSVRSNRKVLESLSLFILHDFLSGRSSGHKVEDIAPCFVKAGRLNESRLLHE